MQGRLSALALRSQIGPGVQQGRHIRHGGVRISRHLNQARRWILVRHLFGAVTCAATTRWVDTVNYVNDREVLTSERSKAPDAYKIIDRYGYTVRIIL